MVAGAGSRHFIDWLAEARVSLAFTTYQTGKLFFVGLKPDRSLSLFERTFHHCMGLWASPDARTHGRARRWVMHLRWNVFVERCEGECRYAD